MSLKTTRELAHPTTPNYTQLYPTTPNYTQLHPTTPTVYCRSTLHSHFNDPAAITLNSQSERQASGIQNPKWLAQYW